MFRATLFLLVMSLGLTACKQDEPAPTGLEPAATRYDCDAIAAELHRWRFGGGKELPGLVARRQAEVAPCYDQ